MLFFINYSKWILSTVCKIVYIITHIQWFLRHTPYTMHLSTNKLLKEKQYRLGYKFRQRNAIIYDKNSKSMNTSIPYKPLTLSPYVVMSFALFAFLLVKSLVLASDWSRNLSITSGRITCGSCCGRCSVRAHPAVRTEVSCLSAPRFSK